MKQDEEHFANRKKQKDTMADWAILMALPFSNLRPLKRYKVARTDRQLFDLTFESLLEKRCERSALETALWMANTVQVETFPNTTRVKSLAEKMRNLADEISRVEGTKFPDLADAGDHQAKRHGPGRCGRRFAGVPLLRAPQVAW
jgi:hypothetical protein